MPPSIRFPFNFAYRRCNSVAKTTAVPVLLTNGDYTRVTWLGFIDRDSARAMPSARPVKILAYGYSSEEVDVSYVRLKDGEYIQGCLIEEGVYGVVTTVPVVVGSTISTRDHK